MDNVIQKQIHQSETRTPRERAQDVWDYNLKLLMAELEIDAEEASHRLGNIPADDHNSITHHLKGEKGFYVRFSTYVKKIMSQSDYTYEEVAHAFLEIAKHKKEKHFRYASINIAPFLALNELENVYKFQDWHFQLLAKKTCEKFHAKNPRIYQLKNSTIVCEPFIAPLALDALPVALPVVPKLASVSSKGSPIRTSKINTNTLLSVFMVAGTLVVALCLVARAVAPRKFGFFNRKISAQRVVNKKQIKTESERDLLLYKV